MNTRPAAAAAIALFAACANEPVREPVREPALELFEWERGIGLRTRGDEPIAMHLWFYEWRLFGALGADEFEGASYEWPRTVSKDGLAASVDADALRLSARVEGECVELELVVRNDSDRAWPEHAAIVACFNPGPPESKPYELGHHRATFMVGADGLERVPAREMHFASHLRPSLEALKPSMEFEFSERWATSARDSAAGLLARESLSGRWSTGVAWDDWLGVQAHNYWLCMHVATRVGPLAPGESKRVRGRLVLREGALDETVRLLRAPRTAR